MKPLRFFSAALIVCSLTGCDNRMYKDRRNSNETNKDTGISRPWKEERAEYLDRMNRKIEEMEHEIKTKSSERSAEKSADKIRDYDADIKRLEKNRGALREKIESIGAATEKNWAGFKKDADEFFKRV